MDDELLSEQMRRRIIFHREAAGLSSAGIARLLHMDVKDYEHMEDGTYGALDPDFLSSYIKALSLTGEEFLLIKNPSTPYARQISDLYKCADDVAQRQRELKGMVNELKAILEKMVAHEPAQMAAK